MGCAFCGVGDRWIKTCRTEDGSRLRVYDPCWKALSPWLMIVPGAGVVTARCQRCGGYFNPREMAELSPGGRHSTYSGTCGAYAEESAKEAIRVPARGDHEGEERP